MAETPAITEEREALELGLREWLDDDATSAAQWIVEIGWRPPAEVDALRARWVAEALEEVTLALQDRCDREDRKRSRQRTEVWIDAAVITRALAAEYRNGQR